MKRINYISNDFLKVIKIIATKYPDSVFCGSIGLIIRGKLFRTPKDIDILVSSNYYVLGGFFDKEREQEYNGSLQFLVGKDNVKCFKVTINKLSVDVLYNECTPPVYDEIKFNSISLRVEKPEAAIKAKLLYIENDNSEISKMKHLSDLLIMEVPYEAINGAVTNTLLKHKKHLFDDLPY